VSSNRLNFYERYLKSEKNNKKKGFSQCVGMLYERINGIELKTFYLADKARLALLPKITAYLLKPWYIATERELLGETYQNALVTFEWFTYATSAGVAKEFGNGFLSY